MPDLEKLFRLCGSGPKPLENFTTGGTRDRDRSR